MNETGYAVEVSQAEFDASVARGEMLMAGPRATRVRFDAFRHRIIVILSTGIPGLLEGRLGSETWVRALAERRAQSPTQGSLRKNVIRRPKRALVDLARLWVEPVRPGSRATIHHR